ncbi:MAG: hypothetical protein Q9169_007181 [Polycauliona sp. 2 TL-2023]
MGSVIPHQDAWSRAKDRYAEDFSKKEKALFENASPESVLYGASAAEKIHASSSSSVRFADKLRPLIAAIEQYGKALDIYANAYPLVLSPLWGSIRVVLHLAGEFGKYFERIVDMFAGIGDLLPRFRLYENLFPSHERLVQALSVAYVDILTFCTDAKAVFRREGRSSHINIGILAKLTWKPFERQFGQRIDNFRLHAKSVDKEASMSHMIEASDSRAVVRANRRQLEKARKEDAHRRIIAAIPSVDMYAKHGKLMGLRQEGTGTWILHHGSYRNWYDAARSSTLCCFGIPGCGKTILASFLVDTIRSDHASHNASMVYCYCDYADMRTLCAETILGTLLKQLLCNGQIPEDLEKKFPPGYGDHERTLSTYDLIDLICMAISKRPFTFVIIDGLDECEKPCRKEMQGLLAQLQGIDSSSIKLFVSCRQEDQLLRSLQGIPTIQMTSAVLEDDIRLFVAASVSSRIAAGELRVRDANLKKYVTDELVNKAHGMFLWVFFQLDDLCEAPSDASIRRIIKDLPDGLIETYERIAKKIWQDKIKRGLARKVFMWMLCARHPLEIEEMREAAGFEADQKSWDSELLPDADLMIEACKGLVIWEREDGLVRFAHHTVQQFLLSKRLGTPGNDLKSTIEEAELYVGEMCLSYLLFSDFETQIQTRPIQNQAEKTVDIPRRGPAYWVPEMLGVPTSMVEQSFRLLGFGSPVSTSSIDFAKYSRSTLETKQSELSQETTQKYRLLRYIIDNWVIHTKMFAPASPLSFRLQVLAMWKTLPFDFRPWGRNQHYGRYGCFSCKPGVDPSIEAAKLPFMSLIHYATEAGNWVLMQSILKDHCEHEAKIHVRQMSFQRDKSKKYPVPYLLTEPLGNERRNASETAHWTICIAARNSDISTVEKLLSFYENTAPHYPDDKYLHWYNLYGSLLNIAASSGNEVFFIMLLGLLQGRERFRKDFVNSFAHITLAIAALHGHLSIVESLQLQGTQIDREVDQLGETSISVAAANGHDDVVRYLIAKGVRLLREGSTPLHRAAQNGHLIVARTILQAAAMEAQEMVDEPKVSDLLNARDREGETPLHQAARNGHANVVGAIMEQARANAELLTAVFEACTPVESGGQTAIHLAAANGHLVVLKLLLGRFGNNYLGLVDGLGQTPLVLTVKRNHLPVVEWILSQHHSSSLMDVSNSTVLEDAIIGGCIEIAQLLLDGNPRRFSIALIILAAKNGQEEIVESIIEAHRGGEIYRFDQTTEKFLRKAFKQALIEKHEGAARLLEAHWKQEDS